MFLKILYNKCYKNIRQYYVVSFGIISNQIINLTLQNLKLCIHNVCLHAYKYCISFYLLRDKVRDKPFHSMVCTGSLLNSVLNFSLVHCY